MTARGKGRVGTSDFVEQTTEMSAALRRLREQSGADGLGIALPGEVVAERYRIVKILGQGGMSRVYLAEHIGIDREVALKVLYVEAERRQELGEHLMSEARVLGRARSQNVIEVYDVCYTGNGDPCIVTEYVDGVSLAELLKATGRLRPAAAIRIALQVAGALRSVHALGVVHRDVKPQNVLITVSADGLERVKLADFGLSSAVLPGAEHGGSVVGTPAYMAPEQAAGEPVDHRADIYAVGCLMCEALAGSRERELRQGKRAFGTPEGWLATLAAARLRPHVQDALETAVGPCLTSDPADRHQSAEALSSSLLQAAAEAGISRKELRLIDLLEAGVLHLPRDERNHLAELYYGKK